MGFYSTNLSLSGKRRGKKNFYVPSTHYTFSQTSTSVRKKELLSSKYALHIFTDKHICRNNFRDHLVDSDWVHMFTHVTEHLNNTDSPIKKSTEAISYATVSKYARQELTSGNPKKFSQSRLWTSAWEHSKSKEKIRR